MTDLTTTPSRFVGCDVGKHSIVAFDSGNVVSVANDPEALAAFAAALDPDCLVICEATGGHEAALLDALVGAGRPAHRADARKVKAFIRSLGTLGKTDAIDACALARYGQERHDKLARWQPRAADRERLHTLVAARLQLVGDRTALSNRIAAPGASAVAERLDRIRQTIEEEIAGLESDIQKLIAASETLERAVRTVRTIGGFGPVVATTIIALMPELGTIDGKKAAALAGLAPHPRQSGVADRYRRTRGGRPEVKRILFMAALSAARHDIILKAFYQRLRDNGKRPLVALTAVMRKMLVIANARLRDQLAAI